MSALYSQIRHEIKTGDLIAWDTEKISSFFGFLLFLYQKIFGAKYTHVGVVVQMGGRVFLVEATPPEVRLIPLKMTSDFYLIKTAMPSNRDAQIEFLLSNLGKKYSLVDLVKSLFKIGNSENDFYCSELAGLFYNEFGYLTDRDAGFTPDTIVNAIADKAGTKPIKVMIDKANVK